MLKTIIRTYGYLYSPYRNSSERKYLNEYWREKTEQIIAVMPYLIGMVVGSLVTTIMVYLGFMIRS